MGNTPTRNATRRKPVHKVTPPPAEGGPIALSAPSGTGKHKKGSSVEVTTTLQITWTVTVKRDKTIENIQSFGSLESVVKGRNRLLLGLSGGDLGIASIMANAIPKLSDV